MILSAKKTRKLKILKPILSIFILILLLFTISCNRKIVDGSHPLFIKAQSMYEEGNYKEASELYKKYLKINPDSGKANFQLGAIYQDQKEYIQAIFYYEKYLDLKPDSSDRPVIERWIIASKKQLLEELESKYNSKDRVTDQKSKNEKKLLTEIDQLKQKNEKMKEFIIKHKDAIKEPETVRQPTSHNSSEQNIYIVEPGDTYYGISKKIYGTAKYFKYIWEYNKKERLRPGDKLIIPPNPIENKDLNQTEIKLRSSY